MNNLSLYHCRAGLLGLALFFTLGQLLAQTPITVSGRVTDETGQPLPGVTILIKGTINGTTTSVEGIYGRGIATNLFTISDIHYAAGDHMVGINTKGLLQTNPDKTIKRPKLASQAAQHVFSLFDNQLELLLTVKPTVDQETVNAFVYRHKTNGGSLVTLWGKEARPAEEYVAKLTTVTVKGQFKQPVFVDLMTGKVYEIPKNQAKKSGDDWTFSEIPVPDYPMLIADKGVLL